MKYSILVVCALHGALAPVEIHAANDNEAVDKARESHDVPDEGGDYEIVVTCLEESTQIVHASLGGLAPRPAGFEVTRFKVSHEPLPHVAEAVYAAREAKAIADASAAKVAQIRAEERAKILAELGQRDPELASHTTEIKGASAHKHEVTK